MHSNFTYRVTNTEIETIAVALHYAFVSLNLSNRDHYLIFFIYFFFMYTI